MSKCHSAEEETEMAGETRTTIYFQPKVYRALKIKAATSDRSLSELVNAGRDSRPARGWPRP